MNTLVYEKQGFIWYISNSGHIKDAVNVHFSTASLPSWNTLGAAGGNAVRGAAANFMLIQLKDLVFFWARLQDVHNRASPKKSFIMKVISWVELGWAIERNQNVLYKDIGLLCSWRWNPDSPLRWPGCAFKWQDSGATMDDEWRHRRRKQSCISWLGGVTPRGTYYTRVVIFWNNEMYIYIYI